MTAARSRGDVHWFAEGRKRPVAYSTSATSLSIGILADDGHTFASAREMLPYDQEAREVLDAYIALGLGDQSMTECGVRS